MWRLIAYRTFAAIFGVIIAFALFEVAVRLELVPPTRQVVHSRHIRMIQGVPVWRDEDTGGRENRECVEQHPDRTRILIFGNSITFGAGPGTSPEGAFSGILQARLNALRPNPGFCVMNFAQRAFAPEQQYAVATEEVPRYRPAVVLRQDWRLGDRFRAPAYKMVGEDAYALDNLHQRADGFPGLRGIPDSINKELFRTSKLYAWLTLRIGETDPPGELSAPAIGPHEQIMMEFTALSRSVGAKQGFFIVPDLSYPFAETRSDDREWERASRELGRKHGFSVYSLRPALAAEDNATLRIDSWHLNAKGHRAVGEKLAPFVLGILDADVLPPGASPQPCATAADAN